MGQGQQLPESEIDQQVVELTCSTSTAQADDLDIIRNNIGNTMTITLVISTML